MTAIERKLRNDPRVLHVDDERGNDNGILVTLLGYTTDATVPCHTFGEDTMTAALAKVRQCTPCTCDECKADHHTRTRVFFTGVNESGSSLYRIERDGVTIAHAELMNDRGLTRYLPWDQLRKLKARRPQSTILKETTA